MMMREGRQARTAIGSSTMRAVKMMGADMLCPVLRRLLERGGVDAAPVVLLEGIP